MVQSHELLAHIPSKQFVESHIGSSSSLSLLQEISNPKVTIDNSLLIS